MAWRSTRNAWAFLCSLSYAGSAPCLFVNGRRCSVRMRFSPKRFFRSVEHAFFSQR
jgi:hypothetical protein